MYIYKKEKHFSKGGFSFIELVIKISFVVLLLLYIVLSSKSIHIVFIVELDLFINSFVVSKISDLESLII